MTKKSILLGFAVAIGLPLFIMALICLAAENSYTYVEDYVTIYPSVRKMIELTFNFWNVLGITIGSTIILCSMAIDWELDVKAKSGVLAIGILLIGLGFFKGADTEFTHVTIEQQWFDKGEAAKAKYDYLFTEPNQVDSTLIKIYETK